MNISQKQKRILICVGYNLILEFWVHNILGFLNPVLSISLLLLYLSYFSMLEDLIVRYKLRDYHVLLIGFSFGLFHETFTTGSVFSEPNFLGINIIILILANIFWWGILQSIFALYFANTFVERSERDERMGIIGWILALSFNIFLLLGRILENSLPTGSMLGYITSLILIGITMSIFLFIKKPEDILEIQRIKFIDGILKIQIFISIVMGVFLVFIMGVIVLYLFIIWSVFTGIIYIIFAIKGKRFIGAIKSTDIHQNL